MPTRSDLAKIHIAKKDLRLDDAAYRDILYRRYRQTSAADLNQCQVADLLALFRAKGWRPVSSGQLGLIHVLWNKLAAVGAIRQGDDSALNAYVAHYTGKEELRKLTVSEAGRVIEMLKKWLKRAGGEVRR